MTIFWTKVLAGTVAVGTYVIGCADELEVGCERMREVKDKCLAFIL